MTHQHDHSSNAPRGNQQISTSRSFVRIVMYVTIGIIVFFLITEHTAHVIGFLPYSLLFICLLMHLFMHGGGHGGHGGGNNNQPR